MKVTVEFVIFHCNKPREDRLQVIDTKSLSSEDIFDAIDEANKEEFERIFEGVDLIAEGYALQKIVTESGEVIFDIEKGVDARC